MVVRIDVTVGQFLLPLREKVRMRGWACKAHIAGLLVPLPAFGGTTLTYASPVKGEGDVAQRRNQTGGAAGVGQWRPQRTY